MAITIEQLIESEELSLRLVAGGQGSQNRVEWAHAIELFDVRPWLKGGELLMTTGMGLARNVDRQFTYVQNLADLGVAGLAFGVGPEYHEIPEAIIDAAEQFGVPLLEVPLPTPFIAITKAVTEYSQREQQTYLRRVIDLQRSMTSNALKAGFHGVLETVCTALSCEAALFDANGEVLAAVSDDVTSLIADTQVQLSRYAGSRKPASIGSSENGQHLLVQVLNVESKRLGHVAVRSSQPIDEGGRLILGHANSVLSLELIKPSVVVDAERALEADVLNAILAGTFTTDDLERQLNGMGFGADAEVTVAIVKSTTLSAEQFTGAHAAIKGLPGRYLVCERDDDVVILCSYSAVNSATLHCAIKAHSLRTVHVGRSKPVGLRRIADGYRQAQFAAQSANAESTDVREFEQLSTYSLLLSSQSPEVLATIAEAALQPLAGDGTELRGELIESLDSFLANNAHWVPASNALGVHRHTLRNRMRRVEKLTGRNLSSAHDRNELWLALKARELSRMALGVRETPSG